MCITGEKMKDKKIKKIGQDMNAHVRIGKNGLNESMISEITRQLEDEDIIKIKVLRNAPVTDADEMAEMLKKQVGCRVVEVRGRTLMLAKK